MPKYSFQQIVTRLNSNDCRDLVRQIIKPQFATKSTQAYPSTNFAGLLDLLKQSSLEKLLSLSLEGTKHSFPSFFHYLAAKVPILEIHNALLENLKAKFSLEELLTMINTEIPEILFFILENENPEVKKIWIKELFRMDAQKLLPILLLRNKEGSLLHKLAQETDGELAFFWVEKLAQLYGLDQWVHMLAQPDASNRSVFHCLASLPDEKTVLFCLKLLFDENLNKEDLFKILTLQENAGYTILHLLAYQGKKSCNLFWIDKLFCIFPDRNRVIQLLQLQGNSLNTVLHFLGLKQDSETNKFYLEKLFALFSSDLEPAFELLKIKNDEEIPVIEFLTLKKSEVNLLWYKSLISLKNEAFIFDFLTLKRSDYCLLHSIMWYQGLDLNILLLTYLSKKITNCKSGLEAFKLLEMLCFNITGNNKSEVFLFLYRNNHSLQSYEINSLLAKANSLVNLLFEQSEDVASEIFLEKNKEFHIASYFLSKRISDKSVALKALNYAASGYCIPAILEWLKKYSYQTNLEDLQFYVKNFVMAVHIELLEKRNWRGGETLIIDIKKAVLKLQEFAKIIESNKLPGCLGEVYYLLIEQYRTLEVMEQVNNLDKIFTCFDKILSFKAQSDQEKLGEMTQWLWSYINSRPAEIPKSYNSDKMLIEMHDLAEQMGYNEASLSEAVEKIRIEHQFPQRVIKDLREKSDQLKREADQYKRTISDQQQRIEELEAQLKRFKGEDSKGDESLAEKRNFPSFW